MLRSAFYNPAAYLVSVLALFLLVVGKNESLIIGVPTFLCIIEIRKICIPCHAHCWKMLCKGKVWGKYHWKFSIWLGAAVEWSKDFSRGAVIFTRLGQFFSMFETFLFRNKKVELDSNLLGVNKKRKKKKSFSSDTESAALQKDSSRSRWGSGFEPKVACLILPPPWCVVC